MNICIYCKSEITKDIESIEHTFPHSFGCPDNWVLDCVCKPCNNTLGHTIEKWLAGDSLEAVLRLRHIGSQSGERLRPKRFQVNIPYEERYGGFAGAIMEKNYTSIGPMIMPSQVGFKNKDGKYVYFTQEDLKYPDTLKKTKTLSQKEVKLLAPKPQLAQLIDFVKKIVTDWQPKPEGEFEMTDNMLDDGALVLEISARIDSDLQRAVAKIAFNYLAKIQGSEFVLDNCFDEIRSFIKGEGHKPFVIPDSRPVLINDTSDIRYLGHIFTIEIDRENNLVAQVSLFNQGLAYHVLLTQDVDPKWDIIAGHFYDPITKEISELQHGKIIRL